MCCLPVSNPVLVPFILKRAHYYIWLRTASLDKNGHKYISPKLCLTLEINSKYFETGECVVVGQSTGTSVSMAIESNLVFTAAESNYGLYGDRKFALYRSAK